MVQYFSTLPLNTCTIVGCYFGVAYLWLDILTTYWNRPLGSHRRHRRTYTRKEIRHASRWPWSFRDPRQSFQAIRLKDLSIIRNNDLHFRGYSGVSSDSRS